MSSVVDICNLALSHLGDNANVSNIDPPEGSEQSEHCARFYSLSRDALLELHDWNFSTTKKQLAAVTSDWAQWQYAYLAPSDCLRVLAILDPTATDDNTYPVPTITSGGYVSDAIQSVKTPQNFVRETDSTGRDIIYTNQEDAVARYTRLVEDPTQFTPLFVQALSWHLASALAGPLLKGETGRKTAQACLNNAMGYVAQAKTSDSRQRNVRPTHTPAWIAGR